MPMQKNCVLRDQTSQKILCLESPLLLHRYIYIYIYILVMIYDPRSSKIIQIHMFVNIYGYMLREWCRLKDQPKKEGGDQAFGISLLKNSKV